MRYIHTIISFWAIAFFSFSNNIVSAQDIKSSAGKFSFTPFKTSAYNFDSCTLQYKAPTTEWKLHNKESLNHPDADFITRDNPANAIEILAKRTYNSRYFIDKDTASKFYMVKSTTDINYLKDGQWLTIDKRISPRQKNKYEASRQPEPVGFDLANKLSYIKTFSGPVYFNNWQLIGRNGDSSTLLAIADWSHFSVGDDGIKITGVFPGIDAEMIVDKGSIETNFIVKQNAFKGYEQLIFTDEFKADKPGGTLVFSDPNEAYGGVDFMVDKKRLMHINSALMYVENKPDSTTETIHYHITHNHLSLWISGNDLNNKLAMGTVLIDPVVTSADSLSMSSIGGSMNDGSIHLSCNYNLVMTTPAQATFTDVFFQFGFYTHLPARNKMGFLAIGLGACNTGSIGTDASSTGYDSAGSASTRGQWDTISSLLGCMPPPACTPQTVTFVLQFYNTAPFGPNGVCSDQYVSPEEAFQILITGNILQMDSSIVLQNGVSSPSTICQTNSTTISAKGIDGVPPYTYAWDHGAGNGSSVSVSPAATTDYTATVTDQCGNTATGSTLITVIPQVIPSVSIAASANDVCGDVPITFSAVPVKAGPSPFYQWEVNGINVGSNDSLYVSDSLVSGDMVSCIVSVSSNGCTISATSNPLGMDIKPIPSIALTASKMAIPKGDTAQLAAVITGGYSSFVWAPTTGLSDPSVTTPVASPLVSTTYLISVTDTDGCVKTDSILVGVYDPITMPNAFTPNGDGLNEYFRIPPTIIGFNLTRLAVYNQWGKPVFETSDINQGWDGTFQGNPCDIGTYVYVITGSNAKGKVFIKGCVSLFR